MLRHSNGLGYRSAAKDVIIVLAKEGWSDEEDLHCEVER